MNLSIHYYTLNITNFFRLCLFTIVCKEQNRTDNDNKCDNNLFHINLSLNQKIRNESYFPFLILFNELMLKRGSNEMILLFFFIFVILSDFLIPSI